MHILMRVRENKVGFDPLAPQREVVSAAPPVARGHGASFVSAVGPASVMEECLRTANAAPLPRVPGESEPLPPSAVDVEALLDGARACARRARERAAIGEAFWSDMGLHLACLNALLSVGAFARVSDAAASGLEAARASASRSEVWVVDESDSGATLGPLGCAVAWALRCSLASAEAAVATGRVSDAVVSVRTCTTQLPWSEDYSKFVVPFELRRLACRLGLSPETLTTPLHTTKARYKLLEFAKSRKSCELVFSEAWSTVVGGLASLCVVVDTIPSIEEVKVREVDCENLALALLASHGCIDVVGDGGEDYFANVVSQTLRNSLSDGDIVGAIKDLKRSVCWTSFADSPPAEIRKVLSEEDMSDLASCPPPPKKYSSPLILSNVLLDTSLILLAQKRFDESRDAAHACLARLCPHLPSPHLAHKSAASLTSLCHTPKFSPSSTHPLPSPTLGQIAAAAVSVLAEAALRAGDANAARDTLTRFVATDPARRLRAGPLAVLATITDLSLPQRDADNLKRALREMATRYHVDLPP